MNVESVDVCLVLVEFIESLFLSAPVEFLLPVFDESFDTDVLLILLPNFVFCDATLLLVGRHYLRQHNSKF